ncbi:MAG: hypothetical protein ABJF04_07425 [Reichenbachiella sp.]|uniref:hypothetical protein n=1 Tax=Reichenbachiella sp. TaxID=2184521 RepID=UPI003264748A
MNTKMKLTSKQGAPKITKTDSLENEVVEKKKKYFYALEFLVGSTIVGLFYFILKLIF